MKIELSCSEAIKVKLNKQLLDYNTNDYIGDVALVERGYQVPEGKIALVFDPIDYMEVLGLVFRKNNEISTPTNPVLTGYHNNRYTLIKYGDVLFIEAFGNEVICHTQEARYQLKKPLYYYEGLLKEVSIIKINKSQLVNLMSVKEIVPWFNSRFVLNLSNGLQLEVSKKYSKGLRKSLDL